MIGWITWHRGILPRGFKRSTKGFMAYKGHKGYIRCHMNDQILAQLTKHVIRPSCIHLRTRTGQMGCSRGHKCSWFSSLQKKNPFHETNCKKWHEFSKHFKTQYEARLLALLLLLWKPTTLKPHIGPPSWSPNSTELYFWCLLVISKGALYVMVYMIRRFFFRHV